MIKPCDCKNVVQDDMFGKGNRQHNVIKHKDGDKYVCTVCRKTNGLRGKTCVRKHPSKAARYHEGMAYASSIS